MSTHMKPYFDTRIIIALSIIAAGVILLADNLGAGFRINIWEWWPLVLIFVGLAQILRPESYRKVWPGIFAIAVGAIFLGNNLDLFYIDFGDIWPVFLIIIGIAMIRRHTTSHNKIDANDIDAVNMSMILGGGEHRFTSRNFKGGNITAILGGGTLDLTEAEMVNNEIEVDVFVMMGGLELRIPKHWHVIVRTTPIMGGIENKTYNSHINNDGLEIPQTGKRFILKGSVMMGGLEVRN